MEKNPGAVLSGGNSGHAAAVDLSLAGSKVNFFPNRGAAFRKDGIYTDIKVKGPGNLKDRFVTEDVPYGTVPLSTVGDLLGIPTPTP